MFITKQNINPNPETPMDASIEKYWTLRLAECGEALKKNNFEVFIADNLDHAKKLFWEEIFPNTKAKSISWGDSLTFLATGVLEELKAREDLEVIVTFDKSVPREEIIERRRRALLVDLFLTGTNAVTKTGELVNLDMVGNRVAGITFGPKHVVLFIGRNKIVPDIEDAMFRIKDYAAPVNAIRHEMKTPCVETGVCMDCKSPYRICNTWVITEKSFPKGRVKVVLINEDLGY
jgi:LUD domain